VSASDVLIGEPGEYGVVLAEETEGQSLVGVGQSFTRVLPPARETGRWPPSAYITTLYKHPSYAYAICGRRPFFPSLATLTTPIP
jgi:hypothetical protein